MRFSGIESVEVIITPGSVLVNYTKAGATLPLSFPGVANVTVRDLRPWKAGETGK